MNELWLPVVGWEGLYEVSNLGRIRRVGGYRTPRPRLLHPVLANNGYLFLHLWRNNRQHGYCVHSLVAAAFIGPCPEGHEVNHIDGDKTHNEDANLEYLTRSENNTHAYRIGKMRRGDRHKWAKLTIGDVNSIRYLYAFFNETVDRLATFFNVSKITIRRVITFTNWKYPHPTDL